MPDTVCERVIVAAACDFGMCLGRFNCQFGESRPDVRYSTWPLKNQDVVLARDVEERLCLSDQFVRIPPRVGRFAFDRVVRLGARRSLSATRRSPTATSCRLPGIARFILVHIAVLLARSYCLVGCWRVMGAGRIRSFFRAGIRFLLCSGLSLLSRSGPARVAPTSSLLGAEHLQARLRVSRRRLDLRAGAC